MSFPSVWPSRCMHSVGARNSFFEAPFLARRCLCLHFTRHLTAPSARLEVKMVRYSFLVGLFHPRLHAGLSRRLRMLTHGGSVAHARETIATIMRVVRQPIRLSGFGIRRVAKHAQRARGRADLHRMQLLEVSG